MHRAIVADTSCFILLSNIDELNLLEAVYGRVTTTPEVVSEFGQDLPDWVEVQSPSDAYRQRILELALDKGEASAIALALEIPGSTIILDDQKARKAAVGLGLEVTGTLGVIVRAKLSGKITSIKPLLAKIRKSNFRIDDEIDKQALLQAGE